MFCLQHILAVDIEKFCVEYSRSRRENENGSKALEEECSVLVTFVFLSVSEFCIRIVDKKGGS